MSRSQDEVIGADGSRIEELWLKIGEEDGGFRLERVALRELHAEALFRVNEESIGVLIVDSNDEMRAGIRDLISGSNRVEVLGVAGNCRDAIQLARRLLPEVVLIADSAADSEVVETVHLVKRELPKVNVLVLTCHEEIDHLIEAVTAGAVGYIVKGTKRGDLLSAIQTAASGAIVIDRTLLPGLLPRISGKRAASSPSKGDGGRSPSAEGRSPSPERRGLAGVEGDNLTKREQEVLDLIADGMSNKEISEKLCITVDTVKSHVHRIIQKLGVSDRTSAAVRAVSGRSV